MDSAEDSYPIAISAFRAISDNGFDASGTHLRVIRIVNNLLQCSLRKRFEFIFDACRICQEVFV